MPLNLQSSALGVWGDSLASWGYAVVWTLAQDFCNKGRADSRKLSPLMIDGFLWVLSLLQLPESRGCSLLFLENRKAPGGFLDPGDRRLLLQEHQQGDIALVIFANSSYLCFVP